MIQVFQSTDDLCYFNGTSRQGSIEGVTYLELEELFGPPTFTGPSLDKCTIEWCIKIEEVYARIYDGYAPLFFPTQYDTTEWKIGAFDGYSAGIVAEYIQSKINYKTLNFRLW